MLDCPEVSPVSESQSSSAPVYADRATGQTFGDARAMVNAYLMRFAARAGMEVGKLDESGYVEVRSGSAMVRLSVMEDVGVLILLAPIMKVPKVNREALYRRLLEASYLMTSDAAFAIDAQADEINVRALRRLSGLDYEEFEDLLDTVGKVADTWDDALREEFGHS
jgi:Tir chaperone protein (CesT) family